MTEIIERPPQQSNQPSALSKLASRFNVDPAKVVRLLRGTVIKPTRDGREATDEEVAAFSIVANQYGLNPFTREIHAFADPQRGVVPIVGIDGWAHIVNDEPRFDGCEFEEIKEDDDLGVQCTMHVKGRAHPITITEWLSECKRNTTPWNTMKRRMLRHKAFMQCARYAFSISGIFDEDEARDIITNQTIEITERPASGLASVREKLGLPAPEPKIEKPAADPDAHDPSPADDSQLPETGASPPRQDAPPAPESGKDGAGGERPIIKNKDEFTFDADSIEAQVIKACLSRIPEDVTNILQTPDQAKAWIGQQIKLKAKKGNWAGASAREKSDMIDEFKAGTWPKWPDPDAV